MKKLLLLFVSIFATLSFASSQVKITDLSTFKTADQMLLANELNESGEPFAEAIGYNLDLLDPMVPNQPDSTAYTLGIENYEYSRYLLGTIISRSGMGLHIMWSPVIKQMAAMQPASIDGMFTGGVPNGFKEDDVMMMMIKGFSANANQMAPTAPFPQFADFISGNMILPQKVAADFQTNFSTLRWDRTKMDKTLNPAAMGQSLMKQYLWAEDMLGAFHDSTDNTIDADGIITPDYPGSPNLDPNNNVFYGGNNSDGFIGQILTAESINKTFFLVNNLAYNGKTLGTIDPATYNPANGIKYFPHKIAVEESLVSPMLPPAANPNLKVTDADSYLFDQLSYLQGTTAFKNMMDPSINDAKHYAYHTVFDGSPFPAPMSQTGVPGPFDLMKGASKVIFLNTLAMHFNAGAGTFVDIAKLENGAVAQVKTITAENAGFSLVVLAEFANEFGGTPLQNMAANALKSQADFIIDKLKDADGGFYNSYKIGSGPKKNPKTLSAQSALIEGLYAAYKFTNNTAYLRAANDAYNFLINNFYVPSEKMFKTEINKNLATYTPYNLAFLSGALRTARLTGNQADAVTIYTRVFKSVYNKMLLSEAEQTGETGGDSDGDGIPYIAGGTKPFVFAAEGTHVFKSREGDDEHHHSMIIKIFPNPATDIVTLSFKLVNSENVDIRIYDRSGRVVLNKGRILLNQGSQTISVNISQLIAGTYFIRLTSENDVIGIGRFIKLSREFNRKLNR